MDRRSRLAAFGWVCPIPVGAGAGPTADDVLVGVGSMLDHLDRRPVRATRPAAGVLDEQEPFAQQESEVPAVQIGRCRRNRLPHTAGFLLEVPASPTQTRAPEVRCSLRHDRRRQRHPVVLGPRWSEHCPRTSEDLVGSVAEHTLRRPLHTLSVEEVDGPAACVCALGQHLPVHDGVGSRFVGCAAKDGDVVGKVGRPGSQRHRHDRIGQPRRELVERSRCRAPSRCPHTGDQLRGCGVVEGPAVVVDRGGRRPGFDQLDPPPVHHLVVSRSSDRHGPTEVMSDAHTHDTEYPKTARGQMVTTRAPTCSLRLNASCAAWICSRG
jgi:hypothetical protein